MEISFNSIRPDYDGQHYQLVNVMGVMTVQLTPEEAHRLRCNPDWIDAVTEFASANVDDLRFTVTQWNWRNSFAFDGDEVYLDAKEWEAADCGECGRKVPCPAHEN